ncbi:MAG TPA: hypothetical protein VN673_13590, partial [Clostridia bacterium]|nr:hypothetical protein [Clostridia bacterium]
YDFSLVLGGPLYQLYRRAHLSGSALELLGRRVVIICLFAWLPPLLLSALEGNAWYGTVRVPFLLDVHAHARFLVAMPLFIVAELVVHQRMRLMVRQFIAEGLVPESMRSKFDAALASAWRWRNSVWAEVLLLALVYGVGVLVIWRIRMALSVATWYRVPAEGGLQPTLAGWWFLAISLPLFQFMLLRWYFRLFIWMRFLWQVSRIDLRLVPTHPDSAGGLGFLGTNTHAFALLLLGQGALLAGWIASRIFFENVSLLDFKIELLVAVILLLVFVLGPLLVFTPRLARTKRTGLREYASLASRYVSEFDRKWLRGGAPAEEALVGNPDIQSLADLGNSFERVRAMRLVPFSKETLFLLTAMILLPVLPLTLTLIPLEEVLNRLLKVVF